MILSEALSGEVREYLKARQSVLIPVGSLEQHGSAAPLACDTIVPVKLCAEAERRTGIAVAPAISYGMSSNHMGFPGTVSLQPRTLSSIVEDIALSLCTHGFKQIIFLSGHGGNREPVCDGLESARKRGGDVLMQYLPYWDLPGAVDMQRELFCPDPGYHVTVTEVSMIWHIMGKEMPDFCRFKFPPEPSPGLELTGSEWKSRYPDGGAGSDLEYVSLERGKEFFSFLVESLCSYTTSIEKTLSDG